jgi:hypothetical protein
MKVDYERRANEEQDLHGEVNKAKAEVEALKRNLKQKIVSCADFTFCWLRKNI